MKRVCKERIRPEITPNETPQIDPQALLEKYINLQHELQKAQVPDTIEITLNVSSPIGIAFTSDWHIGPMGTDLEALVRDIETIVNTPQLYAYVGGDIAQNMILSTMSHFGCLEQGMAINDQWIIAEYLLQKLKPAILAIGDGNHSAWSTNVADVNRVRQIASELHIVYTGHGGTIKLRVGNQQYIIYRSHKGRFNSSFNLSHSAKRAWEFSPVSFDVGVIEHGHEPTIEPFYRHGLERIAVRTGTYLIQHRLVESGGLTWRHGVPVVIFYPNERKMVPFIDLSQAVEFLKVIYAGYGNDS